MPVFGSHYPVTVVRGAKTADEKRWETRMGGDLSRKALFYIDDKIKTGDEIHADVFDEPRIVVRVTPSLVAEGVSHWEAEMLPQSEWQLRHRAALPPITVTGMGARVNVHSVDQSTQNFHNQYNDNAALIQALDDVKAMIQQQAISADERNDAIVDVEQIKMEMQRSKPDKGRIWTLMDRLNGVAGLAEKLAKLVPLLQQLGL